MALLRGTRKGPPFRAEGGCGAPGILRPGGPHGHDGYLRAMPVHVEARSEHVRVVTLDRPERRNALDDPTLESLAAAVTEAPAATRALVLRGRRRPLLLRCRPDRGGGHRVRAPGSGRCSPRSGPRPSRPSRRSRAPRWGGHAAGRRLRSAHDDAQCAVRDPRGQARPDGRPLDRPAVGDHGRPGHGPGDAAGRRGPHRRRRPPSRAGAAARQPRTRRRTGPTRSPSRPRSRSRATSSCSTRSTQTCPTLPRSRPPSPPPGPARTSRRASPPSTNAASATFKGR